jgi:hypothetical protein
MSWAGLASLITAVIAIFTLLDWMISREEVRREKETLVRWWFRLDSFSVVEAIRELSVFFNRRFDSVYGRKAFSWRRVWTSGVTTVVIILAIAIPGFALEYDSHTEEGSTYALLSYSLPFLLVLLFANLLADFVSLSKARLLLRYAESAKTWTLCVLAVIDVVATLVIYFACVALAVYTVRPGLNALGMPVEQYIFIDLPKNSAPMVIGQALVTAAFAGSLLFYSFLVSSLSINAFGVVRPRVMIVLERLEASDNLFKSIGAILAALLALGKAVADLIVSLAS